MIIEQGGEPVQLEFHDLACAMATRTGKSHKVNEDRFLFLGPGNKMAERCGAGYVFGVFDGCGGYGGGNLASQICADVLRGVIEQAKAASCSEHPRLMAEALQRANREVHMKAESQKRLENMACTATTAWIWEDTEIERMTLLLNHVGDSRAYLLRGAHLERLTRDHQVGGVLTRVVGMEETVFSFDAKLLELEINDIIILATDGLRKPMDIDIYSLCEASRRNPFETARSWISKALANGSDDDMTAIVVKIE